MDKIIPKNILGPSRLKDLIKEIRNCKTAADERTVIAKESAAIRTEFKEEDPEHRFYNIEKLLYIYMLGYPAHFGQIECLKLVASPKYLDKKLGYLGTMLLLNENQEVLTLVTNCLQNDLGNNNILIAGLALCTLGNIASQEMARDLCSDVERLLTNANVYIRKKAALCALRIVKKVPDLMDTFVSKAIALLQEKNHAVLLTGVTLLTEMCTMSADVITIVREHVGTLVRLLKNLMTVGFSAEHDVNGITDPFLQVKVLKLFAILGKGDHKSSEAMNDVLAQVATNTDSTKNVGNAVLYEAVRTIMEIEADNSLRVMAINILGKFVTNRDNNVRYVALTTLAKTSQTANATDSNALQRHRAIIIECLQDSDISIRRRALDLSFYLINSQNIRILTRELLAFLDVCEGDIKGSVAWRLCEIAGRYRPNKRWELDTVIRVLRVAGAYVDQMVINYFVKLVSTGPADLFTYTVKKLYSIVKNEGDKALAQEGLVQASVWCIGEYGDLLLTSSSQTFPDEEEGERSALNYDLNSEVTERDVLDFFESLLRGPYGTPLVKQYSLMTLLKLTARFKDSEVISRIRALVTKYRTSLDVELQQRSNEAVTIWSLERDVRKTLLERVPVLESAEKEESMKGKGSLIAAADTPQMFGKKAPVKPPSNTADDLLGLMMGDSVPAPSKPMDALADLFGGISTTSTAAAIQPATAANDLLGDLFGGAPASPPKSNAVPDILSGFASAPTTTNYTVYSKNSLLITLAAQPKPGNLSVNITATFANTGSTPITNMLFQVAVPKTLKLTMMPPSNSTIQAGGKETQAIAIENPTKAPIKLRIKLSYANPNPVDDLLEFSGFDAALWA